MPELMRDTLPLLISQFTIRADAYYPSEMNANFGNTFKCFICKTKDTTGNSNDKSDRVRESHETGTGTRYKTASIKMSPSSPYRVTIAIARTN